MRKVCGICTGVRGAAARQGAAAHRGGLRTRAPGKVLEKGEETVNKALLSSNSEEWATPRLFFDELNTEKCINCKHLYIKDFATGICELKGEIIHPDDSCPKFESSADNTNSLKDGEKGGEGE